ncbi:hypothetical protein KEM48_013406, partial [Puccinia striiformis f. sp. tritici PST-130]
MHNPAPCQGVLTLALRKGTFRCSHGTRIATVDHSSAHIRIRIAEISSAKDAPQNTDGVGEVSLNCWYWFFYTTTKVRTAERKIARMKYDPRVLVGKLNAMKIEGMQVIDILIKKKATVFRPVIATRAPYILSEAERCTQQDPVYRHITDEEGYSAT